MPQTYRLSGRLEERLLTRALGPFPRASIGRLARTGVAEVRGRKTSPRALFSVSVWEDE